MPTFAPLQGLDWFWEMLKLVLASAVPPGRDLPRIIFSEHLSHLSRNTWLGFEKAVVVHTRYATLAMSSLNSVQHNYSMHAWDASLPSLSNWHSYTNIRHLSAWCNKVLLSTHVG